jgi:hypothetical protein
MTDGKGHQQAVRGLTAEQGQSVDADKIVIHLVPKHLADAATPTPPDLSNEAVKLDAQLKTFLGDKIRATFAKSATPVEENTSANSTVPDAARALLKDPRKLVPISQDLAKKLCAGQLGGTSDGLLVAARGAVKIKGQDRPAVLVMKLKIAEGANVEKADGTYKPEFLRGLMLSTDTKVFKTAVLVDDGGSLIGVISDEQMVGGAAFFRETFLGMKRSRSSETVTRDFFTTTMSWIQKSVADPGDREEYEQRLKMTLTDQSPHVDRSTFITTQIKQQHRQDLADALDEAGVPKGKFDKDTEWMRPRQRQIQRDFTKTSLSLRGEAEDFSKVEKRKLDGETVTVIHDTVNN